MDFGTAGGAIHVQASSFINNKPEEVYGYMFLMAR